MQSNGAEPMLVVMLPALDEAATVADVIERIPGQIAGVGEVFVLVVDDGSSDRTAELARSAGAAVVSHRRRRGLGAAFARGMQEALALGADVVVNMDADGQFEPEQIPRLIEPILSGEAEFVTATRFADPQNVPRMPWIKEWGNRQMCRLVNFATGHTRLTDVSCGFRAFSAEAALRLHLSDSFTHVQETVIDLASKSVPMTEVPVKVHGVRQHGRSRMASNLLAYALKTGSRILRAMCRTRPLVIFGTVAFVLLSLGVLQGLFVFVHWLFTHRTSPFRSLLTGSSLFITLGFLTALLALVADMMNRQIDVTERLLYFHRLQQHRRAKARRRRREGGDSQSNAG